jgi:hypothetical protein
MQMNPGIILAGQTPDMMGAFGRGAQVGGQVMDTQRRNALTEMLQAQGPGIMAGNPNALAALARFDPSAALSVQGQRQEQAFSSEQMRLAYEAANRATAEAARSLSAQERAAEEAKIRRGLEAASMAQTPEQWDRLATEFGLPQYVGRFDDRAALLAGAAGAADALKVFQREEATQPGFRPATPEEAAGYGAAGGQFGPDGRFYPINPPSGMSVQVGPDGTMIQQGPGVVGGVGTTVKAGTAPQGYSLVDDPSAPGGVRAVPTPGGPAEQENASRAQAVRMAQLSYETKARVVDRSIDGALITLDRLGNFAAGPGALLSSIPGSGARDLQGLLDTIKANLGFEELQAMRDASPTGGALGQVTERELQYLQSVMGNLDQGQSVEQLRATLNDIKRTRAEFAEQRRAIIEGQGGGQQAPAQPAEIDGFRIEAIE